MGVLYHVVPLGLCDAPEYADWFARFDIMLADRGTPSRHPTPRDIRSALDTLEGYSVHYVAVPPVFDADVSDALDPEHGAWTSLHGLNFEGDEDAPVRLYFAKGWEDLIIRIAERISRLCGPLVFVPDTDAAPVLIAPGISVADAMAQWQMNHRRVQEMASPDQG